MVVESLFVIDMYQIITIIAGGDGVMQACASCVVHVKKRIDVSAVVVTESVCLPGSTFVRGTWWYRI